VTVVHPTTLSRRCNLRTRFGVHYTPTPILLHPLPSECLFPQSEGVISHVFILVDPVGIEPTTARLQGALATLSTCEPNVLPTFSPSQERAVGTRSISTTPKNEATQ
jgi:hypothetical protein